MRNEWRWQRRKPHGSGGLLQGVEVFVLPIVFHRSVGGKRHVGERSDEVFDMPRCDRSGEPEAEAMNKQIKRWLYKARLRPCGWRPTTAHRRGFASYEGRGRLWRVREKGGFLYLDVSCARADFDRWANSTDATVVIIPANEQNFVENVRKWIGKQ